jgi:hypothetical protein
MGNDMKAVISSRESGLKLQKVFLAWASSGGLVFNAKIAKFWSRKNRQSLLE